MKFICAVLLMVGFTLPARAQDERGWSFSGRFSGSANSSSTVLRVDPSIGYRINRYVQTYVGLPFYAVRDSSTSMNGLGNAYMGLRVGVDRDVINYSSYVEVTAPTGDKDRGFSTGRVTADWTNHFSRTFSTVTPFASIGIANTISDTSFFVRPFSSHGLVSHFEGGATADVSDVIRLGASAYAVRASGEQRIVSRVPRQSQGRGRNRVFETQTETVGSADVANDHGFSTWFGVSPRPELDFPIGYNRSVNCDFNSFFFGVGFRIGK